MKDHNNLLKNFREFDVPQKLQIDEGVVDRWLMMMESNYLERNPYHNSTHAADVLAVSWTDLGFFLLENIYYFREMYTTVYTHKSHLMIFEIDRPQ